MTALTAGMMAVMAVTGWAAQPGMHRAGAVSDTARTEAHGDAQYRPAVIDGNIPVSYTHLDVYKRQGVSR